MIPPPVVAAPPPPARPSGTPPIVFILGGLALGCVVIFGLAMAMVVGVFKSSGQRIPGKPAVIREDTDGWTLYNFPDLKAEITLPGKPTREEEEFDGSDIFRLKGWAKYGVQSDTASLFIGRSIYHGTSSLEAALEDWRISAKSEGGTLKEVRKGNATVFLYRITSKEDDEPAMHESLAVCEGQEMLYLSANLGDERKAYRESWERVIGSVQRTDGVDYMAVYKELKAK